LATRRHSRQIALAHHPPVPLLERDDLTVATAYYVPTTISRSYVGFSHTLVGSLGCVSQSAIDAVVAEYSRLKDVVDPDAALSSNTNAWLSEATSIKRISSSRGAFCDPAATACGESIPLGLPSSSRISPWRMPCSGPLIERSIEARHGRKSYIGRNSACNRWGKIDSARAFRMGLVP